MAKTRILVVDDKDYILKFCANVLKRIPDSDIILESDSHRAAERLTADSFDLLIVDIRMPGLNGMALLRMARQQDPTLSALIMTGFPSVETAIESMKLGAADYLQKPFKPDELMTAVCRLLEERRRRAEQQLHQRQVEQMSTFDEMVGTSPAMQTVFEAIERIAKTNADVLIVGETGTGKELVARSIHKRSQQQHGPFVPVDCGAIPGELLESGFFGYERGAFTGASTQSLGLLEFANTGTFFLDEIGELPPRLQMKLLRVLQERKIRRVGGTKEIDVDVRFITATNRDLRHEVKERRFRPELYYRINVMRIELPPLQQRRDDIPLLIAHFVAQYAREMGKGIVNVTSEVIDILSGYSWPGNVRELQNVLRQALALSRHSELSLDHLPDELLVRSTDRHTRWPGGFFQIRAQRIAAFEREYLADLLQTCQGDVAQAARDARLPRGTLYRLLKKHGLTPESFRASR